MNWIQQQLQGPKAADFRDLLDKIEANDQSTPKAKAVLRFKTQYAGGDSEFALWLALVDYRISRTYGIGLFDLADWPMRDAFDDGVPPREAAQMAIASDDTFGGML